MANRVVAPILKLNFDWPTKALEPYPPNNPTIKLANPWPMTSQSLLEWLCVITSIISFVRFVCTTEIIDMVNAYKVIILNACKFKSSV